MRWGGEGEAQGPTMPQALHSPCTRPGQGDCFRLLREGTRTPATPTPRLAAVPQLPGPTPKTAGREAGGGERGAAALLRGWDQGGQRHERARARGGGGRRKPPGGRLPAGSAHLAHRSHQWGGGEELRS